MYGQEMKLVYLPLMPENKMLIDNFSCGNEGIDRYIKEKAVYDMETVTKLVVNSENNEIVCVYSLICSSLIYSFDGRFYPKPAVEIKIFAMNKNYQDIPYSEDKEDGCLSNIIFDHIIGDIFFFTDDFCGANIITLYSTDEGYSFYKRNGFTDFPKEAVISNDWFSDGCYPMRMKIR